MAESVLDRFRLDGRVALVTGGARGLGRAIAAALASAGATVAVTSRDRAAAEAAGGALTAGRGLVLDVRDPASVDAAVGEVVAAFGRLDVLVNNAGLTHRGSLEALSPEQWDDVLDTNLKGAWLCSRAAVPHMRAGGWGRVVNVSSMFSQVALPNRSPYVASKGGLAALTRALAVEVAADGITVNAICPGPFQTDMADAQARAHMLAGIPLGRWGDPAELGPVAVFLASEASSYVTGTTLLVDGGYRPVSSGRALRLAEGLDLATRRVDCVVVIGSTCVGKTTLVDAVRRSAVAQQGRVVVPTRFVTRPSRVNDDMTENVHLTREQFEQRAATGGIGLRWVRRMEDGRRVDYGFERPPARALPVYSGNNALCANPGGVRPPDALAHALLVGVYAPDAERERRLRARSPDLWSGRPAEARYRLAEPADAIRAHAHVVIENHGDLAAEAPAELVRLVTSLADRLAGPST